MTGDLPDLRTGIGFDAHAGDPDRELVLGGVRIPSGHGLAGHSDADVLLHALCDALLGACALPDIGTRFPDTDARFNDADSAELLADVMKSVRELGFRVTNADLVVVADAPKLGPHAGDIRSRVSELLGVEPGRVGFKAKTGEGTGLVSGQSIAAFASVLLGRER